MSDDYLANARDKSLEDDSKITEAELHATHENILEGWKALQDVKRRIMEAKIAAAKKVDEQFHEELKDAEANYALLLTLTR